MVLGMAEGISGRRLRGGELDFWKTWDMGGSGRHGVS